MWQRPNNPSLPQRPRASWNIPPCTVLRKLCASDLSNRDVFPSNGIWTTSHSHGTYSASSLVAQIREQSPHFCMQAKQNEEGIVSCGTTRLMCRTTTLTTVTSDVPFGILPRDSCSFVRHLDESQLRIHGKQPRKSLSSRSSFSFPSQTQ